MDFNFKPADDDKNPLKTYGRNITEEASKNKIDPIIGRDDEIRRIIRVLSRKTKNNPILIGEPGVGKTAIVEGLAQKIVTRDVPENLKDKELIELDVPSLLAGASYQGQFEKRLKDVMKEIKRAKGKIIVFIDEIHTIIGAGKNSQGGMDAAQIIKPMLARGEMRLIGATTLDEHKKYIEPDPAFERRLQPIMVKEPTVDDTIAILRGIKDRFETYHKVKISDDALISATKLSNRYITNRFLPDKAIDLIDEAAAGIQTQMNSKPEALEKSEHRLGIMEMEKASLGKENTDKAKVRVSEIKLEIAKIRKEIDKLNKLWVEEKESASELAKLREKLDYSKLQQQRMQAEGEYEKASALLYKEIPSIENKIKKLKSKESDNPLLNETVDSEEIAEVISRWTGIPLTKLLKDDKEKLLSLEKQMGQRIKGQDKALKTVSEVIMRSRANINDPDKPLGSFIFMGPTGVGKTEVAKTLADQLFDSEKSMIRIDMSEYMEAHSVSRLIGSPPGYVGFDDGGQLSEAVRRNPYSIVLFDEIEKANPRVLDILLQILDDGRITDGKGKVINFKNTILILTTNIASLDILDGKDDNEVKKELSKHLRPEFINRIDEIVIFKPLTKEALNQIVNNELNKLRSRLKNEDIYVTFGKTVIDKIAKESYDPNYGARPVKRYIQKYLEADLARKIISEDIKKDVSYICEYNKTYDYKVKKLN